MNKRKQRVTQWFTWLVITAQILALISTATFTTIQPTPQLAHDTAQAAGLGSWIANAAADLVAVGSAFFGTPKTALAETGSFMVSASGGTFSCALNSSNGVQCWGANASGQLGNGTNTGSLVPVQVTGLTSGVIDIAAGSDFACALTSNGGVKCWGDNSHGQLGDHDATLTDSNAPVDVYSLQNGVVALDGGADHMCALLATGGVKCWGGNASGQIGDGAYGDALWPVDVLGLRSGVAVISAGATHSCAVLTNGTAKCWGDDSQGQLGNTGGSSAAPVTVAVDSSGVAVTGIMAISAGNFHTCALLTTGGLKCWGFNQNGQLGNGTATASNYPVNVTGLSSGVATISAGDYYTCAVLANGSAQCWGYNYSGQLGDGSTTNRSTPVSVSGLSSGVVGISTNVLSPVNANPAYTHTCAALTAGGVRCWGYNATGQLGNNTTTSSSSQVTVSGLTGLSVTTPILKLVPPGGLSFNVQNLNVGSTAQTATLYNASGAAASVSGISLTGTDAAQFAISGGTCGSTFPLALAAGNTCTLQVTFTPTSLGGKSATLAVVSNAPAVNIPLAGVGVTTGTGAPTITSNGGLDTANVSVFENGTFVTGVTAQGASPITFPLFGGADQALFTIDATGNLRFNNAPNFEAPADADQNNIYNVIVAANNSVDSDIQEIFVTVQDAPDTFSAIVGAGSNFSCAVASGGTVKCWGANTSGQIGDGTNTARLLPTAVSGLSGVKAVAVGFTFACALTNAGGVQCWGANSNGQLGDGTLTNSNVPVQAQGLTSGVVAIDAGANHMCVLTSAGGMKCWGANASGQLGSGGFGNVTTPSDVTGLQSGVAVISAGATHSCAVLTNGTAKCWGDDTYGQLGNVASSVSTPATVVIDANGVAVTGFRTISAGNFHTCAAITTGGVKCWGYNQNGQLGNGTATASSYPTDVPSLPGAVNAGGVGVAAISAGDYYTCAALNDGTARCWGYNYFGQLGDGTTTSRNVPVPVSGLSGGVVAISPVVLSSVNANPAYTHTCAATNDGTVKCWGYNPSGQLGYGAAANRTDPVMAGDGTATNGITAPTTPTAGFSPASGSTVAFGTQAIGVAAAPQTITLNNTGASPLTVNSMAASGGGGSYAISGGTCGTTFPIIVNAGASCTVQLTFTPVSAGLKIGTLTVSSDSGGQTTTSTFSMTGTGAAATIPAITSNGGGATASVNVAENSTAVTTVTASGSPAPTFSLVGGADQTKFTINTTTGALTFASAPDFETPTDSGANNVYDVTVRATNSGGTDEQAIAVTVTDVSESSPPDLTVTIGQPSPSFTAGSASNVPVTVANVGSGPTTGSISVSVTLPTGTSAPASFTSGAWSCTTSGQTVTCTQAGPIAAGGSSAIQLPVTPAGSTVGTTPGPFNGSATTTGETNTGNNGATPMTPTTPVAPASAGAPDLTVTIGQPSPSFVAGSASNVPVTVANVGSGPTTGSISASVTLPTGTSAPASFTSGA